MLKYSKNSNSNTYIYICIQDTRVKHNSSLVVGEKYRFFIIIYKPYLKYPLYQS